MSKIVPKNPCKYEHLKLHLLVRAVEELAKIIIGAVFAMRIKFWSVRFAATCVRSTKSVMGFLAENACFLNIGIQSYKGVRTDATKQLITQY